MVSVSHSLPTMRGLDQQWQRSNDELECVRQHKLCYYSKYSVVHNTHNVCGQIPVATVLLQYSTFLQALNRSLCW